jgi:hypothetical protein
MERQHLEQGIFLDEFKIGRGQREQTEGLVHWIILAAHMIGNGSLTSHRAAQNHL